MRELIDAALMAPAGEFGVEEGSDTGAGHVTSDEASSQSKDVGVIVGSGELRRQRLVDLRAPTPGFPVHRHRDTDA